MKKYGMIMLFVMATVFLIVPLTLQAGEAVQAEEEKESKKMESGKETMGKMHHDWLSPLNLEEEVLQKIKEMKLKNKEIILELKNKIEKKELEMEKVLMEKKLDFNKILSIHDEIANLKQKISRKEIEQKIEMYKLIPDDKKEEAKKLFLHKFLRKSHGKHEMHGETEMHGEEDKPGCPMKK